MLEVCNYQLLEDRLVPGWDDSESDEQLGEIEILEGFAFLTGRWSCDNRLVQQASCGCKESVFMSSVEGAEPLAPELGRC